MYHVAYILLLLTLLIDVFFGLVVLLRVYQKAFGWYFVLTVLGLILWILGDAGLLFARDARSVHAFAELFYIAPMITPVFIWFFAVTFPENHRLPKRLPVLAALPFTLIAVLLLLHLNLFIKGVHITNTLNISTPALPGFYVYSAYFSFFFILAYIAFLSKIRRLRGISRIQVQYTFFGVLVGSILALISNLSLPALGVRDLIWLGPFFTLFFPTSVAIAIVRHHLFDIKLVIARSVGYIFAVISLALTYSLLALLVINQILFRHSHVQGSQQFVYAMLAVGLAFTFYPARRFFEKMTNSIFYRDAYDSQEFFNAFNRALVSTVDLDRLLHTTAEIIATYLKAQYCLIGVKDGEGKQRIVGTQQHTFTPTEIAEVRHITPRIHQTVIVADELLAEQAQLRHLLYKDNVAVLVRITDDVKMVHEGLGYIVLGQKKSGNPYTAQDVNVLEAAANELLIAIQNALRFEEIERFTKTLQQKVENATKQLRQKNDRLRLLDQTKDDFISMASHQLRTPLTSVKGYLSMVLDGDAGAISPMQRKLLTQSFVSSQRMVYLIADLLNISRLRTGKFVIESSPTNLARITKEEVDQLVDTAKGRGLELSYQEPEQFPTYMFDETKLRQVIMNFIDNAIYYTPSGGHIVVEIKDKPETIELTVTDDGIGVSRAEQHHLFTKFYRAPNARRARPDGTGLGLFMAKKVILAQGGATIFRSAEGKGSTFGFSFAKRSLTTVRAKRSRDSEVAPAGEPKHKS